MEDFALYVAVGFIAQLVDGALGMAFGLLGTSVMMAGGVPPAIASASVHAAEVFTTAISGYSHWRFKNVDWNIARRLALPGAIGGALGAFILSSVPADTIRPVVDLYLLSMGSWILWRALRRYVAVSSLPNWLPALGLGGGFLDAIGGGGWGPIVTSTLIGRGAQPRFVIGSVSLSEFFVTLVVSATFLTTIGLELWPIIAGLILGGALAAPIAAIVASRLRARVLMIIVGLVIIGLSGFALFSMELG
jgi:hypothetical protein